MFDQCWPNVYDVGPTLAKHRVDESCWAGIALQRRAAAAHSESLFWPRHSKGQWAGRMEKLETSECFLTPNTPNLWPIVTGRAFQRLKNHFCHKWWFIQERQIAHIGRDDNGKMVDGEAGSSLHRLQKLNAPLLPPFKPHEVQESTALRLCHLDARAKARASKWHAHDYAGHRMSGIYGGIVHPRMGS